MAGALSVPEDEADMARLARLGRLRGYLADDLRVQRGRSGDSLARRRCRPRCGLEAAAGSGDVHFADVQVFVESDDLGARLSRGRTDERRSRERSPDRRRARREREPRETRWRVGDYDRGVEGDPPVTVH